MLRLMASQDWVEHGLAVAMLATAGYCAACLVVPKLRRAASHPDADMVHVVMAGVMAAMLLGIARPLWAGLPVVLFTVPALWFAFRAVRALRSPTIAWCTVTEGALGHVQLSVAGVAMVYMSGVVPGFGSEAQASGAAGAIPPVTSHDSGHAMTAVVGSGSAQVDFALAGALIFAALAAFAFVNLGQIFASRDQPTDRGAERSWPRRLTLCCQLAMAATMAHMIAAMM